MIIRNSYKAKNLIFLFFCILLFIGTYYLISSINLKNLIKSEIQGIQRNFVTFSSSLQLFDDGDKKESRDIKLKDIMPASKQILNVMLDGLFRNKNQNLSDISLFIKFKNLNKIYNDREKALTQDINYNSQYVPCKISDGFKIFKCKVKLKGDLENHWYSKMRLSLRIKIKEGYIYGLKNFSAHKPSARQFPYDQTFHKLNKTIGGLSSSDQRFVNFRVNNQNWGVMNIEPTINDEFIEVRGIKRSGVFRISNQDNWKYNNKNKNLNLRDNYFISDPTLYFSQKGKDSKIMSDKDAREIYSYIFHSLNSKNSEIFDRKKMIDSLILSLSWGHLHVLKNSNSFYTWNSYTQKLEPILSDQEYWRNIKNIKSNIFKLPFEYMLLFKNSPITTKEYLSSLKKIDRYIKSNDPLKIANDLKINFFPNDRKFVSSPVKGNINFLKDNSDDIIMMINESSKQKNIDKIGSNFKFENHIESLDDFVKVIHFTDGIIQIYNLLSRPVFISKINFRSKDIEINKIIPSSKKNSISKIEIESDFIGEHDKQIYVNAIFKDIQKISKNGFSLINLSHFKKNKYHMKDDVCKNKREKNFCFISGKHIFSKNIIFKQRVIIEKGTEFILLENSHIIFSSSVEMKGEKKHPILISGNDGSVSIFNSEDSISSINYVNFSNLSNPSIPLSRYTGSVNGYGGKFEIKNSKIMGGNSEDQLNIVNAKIAISNLDFQNAKSDSFDCDFCKGFVSKMKFNKVNGDALDLSGSNLNISEISISSVADKAISIGENSHVELNNIFIENVSTGVAVKDASVVEIEDIELKNIFNDAFMTYVKKPFFKGTTSLKVARSSKINKLGGHLCVRANNTFAEINGNKCKVSAIDVKELYDEGRMKK